MELTAHQYSTKNLTSIPSSYVILIWFWMVHAQKFSFVIIYMYVYIDSLQKKKIFIDSAN